MRKTDKEALKMAISDLTLIDAKLEFGSVENLTDEDVSKLQEAITQLRYIISKM